MTIILLNLPPFCYTEGKGALQRLWGRNFGPKIEDRQTERHAREKLLLLKALSVMQNIKRALFIRDSHVVRTSLINCVRDSE